MRVRFLFLFLLILAFFRRLHAVFADGSDAQGIQERTDVDDALKVQIVGNEK